jgi:hypothetical protein
MIRVVLFDGECIEFGPELSVGFDASVVQVTGPGERWTFPLDNVVYVNETTSNVDYVAEAPS